MSKAFSHQALNLQQKKPIVFTAISKKNFYMRMIISQFVLNQGKVPINPFMSFDYYLADMVDRDVIRNANNSLLAKADELWVFGSISDGVMAEIKQCKLQNKPIRYFAIENDRNILEIGLDQSIFEEGVEQFKKDLI